MYYDDTMVKNGRMIKLFVVLWFPLCVMAQPLTGEVIALTCYSCHGEDGTSLGMTPSLNDLPNGMIQQMMFEFASNKRKSTIMGRVARSYSKQEIAAVATYIANRE